MDFQFEQIPTKRAFKDLKVKPLLRPSSSWQRPKKTNGWKPPKNGLVVSCWCFSFSTHSKKYARQIANYNIFQLNHLWWFFFPFPRGLFVQVPAVSFRGSIQIVGNGCFSETSELRASFTVSGPKDFHFLPKKNVVSNRQHPTTIWSKRFCVFHPAPSE